MLERKSGSGLHEHIGRGAPGMARAGWIPLDIQNDEPRVPRLQRRGVPAPRCARIILASDEAHIGGREQRIEAPAFILPKDG